MTPGAKIPAGFNIKTDDGATHAVRFGASTAKNEPNSNDSNPPQVQQVALKAIIFDFDQTLSPHTLADPILKSWGLDPATFWRECNALQQVDDGFDPELSYLYKLVELGRQDPAKRLNAAKLRDWGKQVELYPGVTPEFFESLGLGQPDSKVKAFIVSGGLREQILGCLEQRGLSRYFEAVFACRMAEEDPGDGLGPRLAFPKETVGFTAKTQKLFAISKGSYLPGGPHVNDKLRDKSFNIPFSNMLYIGDGHSDIAAFALLKKFGGSCIAVHHPGDKAAEAKARGIAEDGRAQVFCEAEYKEGSGLGVKLSAWANLT